MTEFQPKAVVRISPYYLACAMLLVLAQPSFGQVARIGRLPLLATVAQKNAVCAHEPANNAAKALGASAILSVTDSVHGRLVSLAVASDNHPRILHSTMSTHTKRRMESESVEVFFAADGTIARGERRASTLMYPSSTSKDRTMGLLPGDSSAVLDLVSSLFMVCRE